MQKSLFPIFYFPPVAWFSALVKESSSVFFEQFETFPKQTYRNRTSIYAANGKLSLMIPIQHSGSRLMKDIQISDVENWRKQHWKSIESAYRGSPYFEFYEDKIKSIVFFEERSLLNFNRNALEVLFKILKIEIPFQLTNDFETDFDGIDYRNQFSAKSKEEFGFPKYYQTFDEKFGFIENLSILDVICNLGPESLAYLKQIKS